MTSFTKKFHVNKTKQLIDINGNSINFEIFFQIKSIDGQPFEMVVVDQTKLDNDSPITYQKVDSGEIKGQVFYDKNIFQNHYIVLRSDNPTECIVEIQKKELPIREKVIENNQIKNQKLDMIDINQKNKFVSKLSWSKILLIILVIAGLFFLFNYFQNRKSQESNDFRNVENPIALSQKSFSPSDFSRSKSNSLPDSNYLSRSLSKSNSRSINSSNNDIVNKIMSLKV